MKYLVSVEKRMYATGVVSVEAGSPEKAVELVEKRICSGKLQSTAVEWSDPTYEDLSFAATGDVDAAPAARAKKRSGRKASRRPEPAACSGKTRLCEFPGACNETRCGAVMPGVRGHICTRKRGHRGRHVACGVHDHNLEAWEDGE